MNFDFPVVPTSFPGMQLSQLAQPQLLPGGVETGVLLGLTQFDAAMLKAMASTPPPNPTTDATPPSTTLAPVAASPIPALPTGETLQSPVPAETTPAALSAAPPTSSAPLPTPTPTADAITPIITTTADATPSLQPAPAPLPAPAPAAATGTALAPPPSLPPSLPPLATTLPIPPEALPVAATPTAAPIVDADAPCPDATDAAPVSSAPRSDTGNRHRAAPATRRSPTPDDAPAPAAAISNADAVSLPAQILPAVALAVDATSPQAPTADAPLQADAAPAPVPQSVETLPAATQQQHQQHGIPAAMPEPAAPAGPAPAPANRDTTIAPGSAELPQQVTAPSVAAATPPLLPTELPAAIAGAAPPPAPTSRAAPIVPAAQVAPVLVSLLHAADGTQRLTLRLDPPELGHVQIRIERPPEAPARVEIVVERQETLNMLVRDQVQLQRALDQAGVPADGRSVIIHVASAEPAPRPEGGLAAASGTSSASTGDASYNASRQGGSPARHQASFADDTEDDFIPVASPSWTRGGLDITA
jgi:flagellar hook-length control protein FliK